MLPDPVRDPLGPEPPIEITLWWCMRCGSIFIHNIGTKHIPQVVRGPSGPCDTSLQPLRFWR